MSDRRMRQYLAETFPRCKYCNHIVHKDKLDDHIQACCNDCSEQVVRDVLRDIVGGIEEIIEEKIETYTGKNVVVEEVAKYIEDQSNKCIDNFDPQDIPKIIEEVETKVEEVETKVEEKAEEVGMEVKGEVEAKAKEVEEKVDSEVSWLRGLLSWIYNIRLWG